MHKTIAIKTDDLSLSQVGAFVATFAEVVKGRGQGSGNRFGKSVGVEPTDGLRVFGGVPEEWLTFERQRLCETIYGYVIDCKLGPRPEVWTENPSWCISNPNAATESLDQCALDVAFVANFGLSNAEFERDVLRSGGIIERTKQETDSAGDRLRAYMALAMFGFADPSQFFCRR